MYASNSHSYTHLILALGIVREPTVWLFITSKYPGIHDIGLPTCIEGPCSSSRARAQRYGRRPAVDRVSCRNREKCRNPRNRGGTLIILCIGRMLPYFYTRYYEEHGRNSCTHFLSPYPIDALFGLRCWFNTHPR